MSSSKLWRSADALKKARVALQARSGGVCEGNGFSDICTGVGTQAHHMILRSQGGVHDPELMLWLCAFCHHDAHHEPVRAREAGLIRSAPPVHMGLKTEGE